VHRDETVPLSERTVVRRGLLAGLAGLSAAAMLRVTGAGKAEAANGDPIIIGSTTNAGTSETRLLTSNTSLSTMAVSNGNSFSGGLRIGILGGAGTGVAANCIGVSGFTNNSGSGALAVQGSAPAGVGVQGICASAFAAVQGVCSSTGFGVRGVNSANGVGVKGVSNAAGSTTDDGTGSGIGVQGKSTNGPGVEGVSVNSLGLRGISTNFGGVVGISTNSHGLYGSTSGAGGIGLVGENLGGGLAGYFAGSVLITGNLQVFGAKNAVIKMQDGTNASVYCQESPEPYFEDFGRGQLVGGVANVALEREFASLIAGGDYMVFTHPEGDTRGLFISRRNAGGFEVREVQGGTGNVPFTYRIVTKRKDIEGRRFARVSDDAAKTVAASRVALGIAGASPVNNAPPNPVAPPAFAPPSSSPAPVPPMNPSAPNNQTAPGPIQTNPDQPGIAGLR
jgi:hypothetical protein